MSSPMASVVLAGVAWVVSYAVNSLWLVPLAAGAAWLAARMLARVGPGAQHRAWVTGFLLAILLPAWPVLPGPLGGMAFRAPVGSAAVRMLGAAGSRSGAIVTTIPGALLGMIFLGYGCAVAYFLLRFVWSAAATAALVRNSRSVPLGEQDLEIWRQSCQGLRVSRAVLLCSAQVSGPVTAGVRVPAVIVPPEFLKRCSAEELLVAMGHECAHIRRRDFLKHLLYQAAGTLIAYHPAAWFLQRQVAQTRELECDRLAASLLPDGSRYAQSLLRLAALIVTQPHHPNVYAIGTFDAGILEKRVMRMQTKRNRLSAPMRFAVAGAAALLLAGTAIAGASSTVALGAAAADGSNRPVYRLGPGVTSPKLISSVDPEFPKSFRAKGKTFGGICVVKLIVNTRGLPEDVQVVRSLAPAFDANAITAVKQYRFHPATRNGQPVAVAINIEVNFQMF
jgi:TonB family protein